MTEAQFIPKTYTKAVENGSFTWSSPSNIALVKYWGKKKDQIPENPSISFTLNNCKTTTTLSFSKKTDKEKFSFDVFLDGEKKDGFKPKIETFFKRVETYLPFLKEYHFKIETSNTFPHSSGIASSASGMSALALCLMSVEKELLNGQVISSAVDKPQEDDAYFIQKASFLARLGSGSACRSLEGDLVVWGKNDFIEGSSDLFGVKFPHQVHDVFKNYQDTILLVDKGEKQVSSTVGHNLMHGHPFAQERFKQAHENLEAISTILQEGELDKFIALVESEALTLHAMMMTSMPYFILMKPNTLQIINKIWAFRAETGSKVCFTLDAGANVHVLYPEKEATTVLEFIQTELAEFCQNGQFINDKVGFGAKLIKSE
ncbi:diphosphomevalonate decarboxylase [Tamlana sp. 2_MG-2023]|uniref:diphosphomevalonate/mevalonate 3,5-bisphosphate decarboxylase family protein n=1 Tax=unclassified Tamlana TaxID=2614803 RepID=UPI0026E1D40D|nr:MULTISPECIES: diphosphomevalonate decarboxylase [unclassified Tamlana]MDO6760943.1 diphosphomevalonate decarboxylase [Tamlana sp. 2_MG-2023]MDO6791199.1 diphosphomevalonate decarboxylase [Tamlana sp. 1_MG-2023]